jgi:hypothetical protein
MADLPSAEELQEIRNWKGLTTPERQLLALIDALGEALERYAHHLGCEDCWYSCPAHPEYCGEEPRECICGADENRALLARIGRTR